MRTFELSVAVFAVLLAAPAYGALLSGTGGAPGALPSGTVINFDATTAGNWGSLSISGVVFKGMAGDLTIGSEYAGKFNNRGTQSMYNFFDPIPQQFQFVFAAPVSAFAFNFGASDVPWVLAAFDSSGTLIESHSLSRVLASNAGDYFGISAAGIKRATLTASSFDYVFIEEFTVNGDRAFVPEPGTFGLMAGAAGLALLCRWRWALSGSKAGSRKDSRA